MTLVSLGKGEWRVQESLTRATLCRTLAVALRAPKPGHVEELSALAEALPRDTREPFLALAKLAGPDLESEHHRLLGAGGSCPPAESDHLPWRTLGGKGPILGDVAAFYRAFAFEPDREQRESPDHVAVELSFLGWMHLRAAHARHEGLAGEAEIVEQAINTFMTEHAATWLGVLATRLEEKSGGGYYAAAAKLLRDVVGEAPEAPRKWAAPDNAAFAGVMIDSDDAPRAWPSPPSVREE